MTLRDLIQSNPAASDAEIAAIANADSAAWRRVESNAVLEWLGGNGRLARMEGWIAATADAQNANVQALRSVIRVLLMSASNPTTYLTLNPASQQRALLGFAVQAQALDQSDAAALIDKARTRADVTAADVAAERAAIAAQQARDTLANRAASLAAWIQQQASAPTGEEVAKRWEASN